MKTLFAVLFFSVLSFASTDCQSTFHVGSGQTAIAFCVTANGNIAYFSSGLPQIQDGAEGYALCNGSGADAWDLGLYGDSGNWLPAVITQPGGPGTFPLTISRSTSDGWKTITQAFSALGGGKGVHVKMTVTGAQNVYRFGHVQLPPSNLSSTAITAPICLSSGVVVDTD